MKKHITIIGVILLALAAAASLAAIFIAEFTDFPVYVSYPYIAVLALLAFGTLISCFIKRRFSVRTVGFIICHVSFVLLLASAFCGYIFGMSGQMTLQSGGFSSRTVYAEDEQGSFDLDYTIACEDFQIEYEPYKYVFSVSTDSGYAEKGKADLTENGLDCGKYGVIPLAEFLQDGMVKTQVMYQNLLATWDQHTPSVTGYTAYIRFSDSDEAQKLSVNHPVTHKKEKIYLISYMQQGDETGMHYLVSLKVKRDPAVNIAIIALALCPAGAFMLCLGGRKKSADTIDAGGEQA